MWPYYTTRTAGGTPSQSHAGRGQLERPTGKSQGGWRWWPSRRLETFKKNAGRPPTTDNPRAVSQYETPSPRDHHESPAASHYGTRYTSRHDGWRYAGTAGPPLALAGCVMAAARSRRRHKENNAGRNFFSAKR